MVWFVYANTFVVIPGSLPFKVIVVARRDRVIKLDYRLVREFLQVRVLYPEPADDLCMAAAVKKYSCLSRSSSHGSHCH